MQEGLSNRDYALSIFAFVWIPVRSMLKSPGGIVHFVKARHSKFANRNGSGATKLVPIVL
jgi:hypothetical protein